MKRILIVSLAMLLSTSMAFAAVQATRAQATLTEEQRERIVVNCVGIKNTLNRLKVSDALLRVNRGQIYESMRGKLMEPFNDRLGNNSLDNRGLVAATKSYNIELSAFRSDYQSYERQLIAAIQIDCTEDPDAFHFAIENARILRQQVNDGVGRLHEYIDDYRNGVSDFRLNYERVSGDSQ